MDVPLIRRAEQRLSIFHLSGEGFCCKRIVSGLVSEHGTFVVGRDRLIDASVHP